LINVLYTSIDEDNHQKLVNKYLLKFSAEFQAKIKLYRRWQDAQLSLLGRVLLAKGMEQVNQVFDESDIKYSSFSKPYLDNSDMNFNISHSGNIVICALTKIGDIGIDIEKRESIKISDFKSQMTNNEWEQVNGSKDIKTAFFKYWTQKEAVIKAHGKGLSVPLKSFEIKNNKATINSKNFFLKKLEIMDDYSCYIASKTNLEVVEVHINKIDY
jgi:4'-phosphopantetheinyl transferase